MIAMSNFEEFARAVGNDVKDIKEQQLTKSEFNSKDCITGNSEYDFLKRSVQELGKQNKLLQEQLALIKPAPRRAPMAYTLDRTTIPWTTWFDNGCGLQLPTYPDTPTINGYEQNINLWNKNWAMFPLIGNIISLSRGTLTLENVKKTVNATYWGNDTTVLNPINDIKDWDFSNALFTSGTDWRTLNQRNIIRVMYQLGIWDAKTIESLGAVKR